MERLLIIERLKRSLVAACMAGVAVAAGCSANQVEAILAGVEAARSSLEGGDNDDITLSDWLLSELEN